MIDISQRIKELRESEGLRAADFARRIDEKLQKVQDIERGKQRPPVDFLEKLVDIFHVSGTWLLTGRGEMKPSNGVREDAAGYDVDTFEAKLKSLKNTTNRVMHIAERRKIRPDPLRLGPLRDIAMQANLTDEQISRLLDLLETANDPEFWIDS